MPSLETFLRSNGTCSVKCNACRKIICNGVGQIILEIIVYLLSKFMRKFLTKSHYWSYRRQSLRNRDQILIYQMAPKIGKDLCRLNWIKKKIKESKWSKLKILSFGGDRDRRRQPVERIRERGREKRNGGFCGGDSHGDTRGEGRIN